MYYINYYFIILPNWEFTSYMKLIGLEKILPVRDDLAKKWLLSWIAEVREAGWRQASDILNQYPKACMKDQGCFEFSINNTQWIICLQVAFSQGIAIIKDVKSNGGK